MMRELLRRIRNVVATGVTTGKVVVVNGVPMVQVRLSALQTLTLPLAEMRGFAANVSIGTPVVALFVAGDRSNGMVVASTAPTARPGTVTDDDMAIYAHGSVIRIGADGVHIEAATDVFVDGNLRVKGEVTAMDGTGASVTLSKHKGHDGGGQPPTPGT